MINFSSEKPEDQNYYDLRYLQQKQRYQTPEILPVCENNHNRPNLVFIGLSVVRLS